VDTKTIRMMELTLRAQRYEEYAREAMRRLSLASLNQRHHVASSRRSEVSRQRHIIRRNLRRRNETLEVLASMRGA
jgi:uncharacterized protein (DUF2384 family)